MPEQVWIIGRQENHLGDCEKMQLVQGYLLARELKPNPPTASSPQAQVTPATPRRNFLPGMPRQSNWITGWKG